MHKSAKRETIFRIWEEYRTQEKPPFTKITSGRKHENVTYELGLIYPNNSRAKKTYSKDNLGRNVEVKLNDEKSRIKELIPYWFEERIFDDELKRRVRYYEMMDYIMKIEDIAQIFTLNNRVIVQVENDIKMYVTKTVEDSNRLFDIIRDDLLKRKRGNFIFVRDINSAQRSLLYDMLESLGYKRTDLFRHYTY